MLAGTSLQRQLSYFRRRYISHTPTLHTVICVNSAHFLSRSTVISVCVLESKTQREFWWTVNWRLKITWHYWLLKKAAVSVWVSEQPPWWPQFLLVCPSLRAALTATRTFLNPRVPPQPPGSLLGYKHSACAHREFQKKVELIWIQTLWPTCLYFERYNFYLFIWIYKKKNEEKGHTPLECCWFSFAPAENPIRYGDTVSGLLEERRNVLIYIYTHTHTHGGFQRSDTPFTSQVNEQEPTVYTFCKYCA